MYRRVDRPMWAFAKLLKRVARPERVELPTFWFVARRSIQLSYGRTFILCNLRAVVLLGARVRASEKSFCLQSVLDSGAKDFIIPRRNAHQPYHGISFF